VPNNKKSTTELGRVAHWTSNIGKNWTDADHRRISSISMPILMSGKNKVDVLHVRLTELHAAHQNLPPAIHTLCLRETI